LSILQIYKQKFPIKSDYDPKIALQALNIVTVIYQSPMTVVLQGNPVINPLQLHFGYTNTYIWRAVDLVKVQGYSIDSITRYGLATPENPTVYTLVLSHK
jgi:hypothetical protein